MSTLDDIAEAHRLRNAALPSCSVPIELIQRVEQWFALAVDAFEGNPEPSEIQGKNILADLRIHLANLGVPYG